MHLRNEHEETICVVPPEVSLEGYSSLAVPVYRASTIVFSNAAEYRERALRGPDGYTYGLAGTPTTKTLEKQLAALHSAERAIIVPSGQAAISVAFLTLLSAGDHLLVADNVYPPVKQLTRDILSRLKIEVEFFDPRNLDDLRERLIPGRTRLVWVESPGSTSMEICDLREISCISRQAGALVGCDNTWATGLLCKPLHLGVDFVAEALTKHAGGHSDLLLGALIVQDLALFQRFKQSLASLGIGVSPDECSLALRGIQTMPLRLRHSGDGGEVLARRLAENYPVEILHPCLPSFEGHEIWRRDFKGSAGVFSVGLTDLQADRIDVALDTLRTFAIGASWGGTRSLVAPMNIDADRHVRSPQSRSNYLRISIGLEAQDDLWADLKSVFDVLCEETTHANLKAKGGAR